MSKLLSLLVFTLISVSAFSTEWPPCENRLINNPLLSLNRDTAPIPFDKIRDEHFKPAFREVIKLYKARVDALHAATDKPTLQNTVLAIEHISDEMDQLYGVFSIYEYNFGTERIKRLSDNLTNVLAPISARIWREEKVFVRVKAVKEDRDLHPENYSIDERRLIDDQYEGFIDSGINLPKDKRERLTEISQRIGILGNKFSENVTSYEEATFLLLDKAEDLAGVPERIIKDTKARAEEKKQKGYRVPLMDSMVGIILKECSVSATREKILKLYAQRGNIEPYNNQALVLEIQKLHDEYAKILGYQNYAKLVLEDRMIKEPTEVVGFLEKIYNAALPKAKSELESLKSFRQEIEGNSEMFPWDYGYYSNLQRKKLFGVSEESMRKYFEFGRVLSEGIFKTFARLYDLKIVENKSVPTVNADIRVFDVSENQGKFLGRIYIDPFEREGLKRGGAWQQTVFSQFTDDQGKFHPAVVGVTMNMEKPASSSDAVLVKPGDVHTLFHEFGHAFHSLLSNVRFASMAGTNVERDLVELPSQLMENWAFEPEVLNGYARDVENGELIPTELISQFRKSHEFGTGMAHLRQLSFGILDLTYYTTPPAEITSVEEFERQTLQRFRLLPNANLRIESTSFSHIFGGGYEAGYYAYLWGNILEADIFSQFQKHGLFNRDLARRFREKILSRGSSRDGMELFVDFMNREPDPKAYMKRSGLTQ